VKFPVGEGKSWISHSHARHGSSITMLLSWPSSSWLSSKEYDSCQCCMISSGVLCRKGARLRAGLTGQGTEAGRLLSADKLQLLPSPSEMPDPCSTQTGPWPAQSKPILKTSDSIGSGPWCSSESYLQLMPLSGYSVRCTIKFLHK